MRLRKVLAGTVGALVFGASAGSAWADTITVTKRMDKVDPKPNNGVCEVKKKNNGDRCSLRAAIQTANADPGTDRIKFTKDRAKLTIDGPAASDVETGDLDVISRIVIRGGGVKLNARGIDRAFDITTDGRLTVFSLNVKNGAPEAGESGGAYRNRGILSIADSRIRNSTVVGAGASGGAIENDGGQLVVSESFLAGNSAARAGGAIEVRGLPPAKAQRGSIAGTTTVVNSRIESNSTGDLPGNGGGVHVTGNAPVFIEGSVITENTAVTEGGGLWNGFGTMRVSDSRVTDNVANGGDAEDGGGGLLNNRGELIVEDGSTVRGNDALGTSGSGGGILNLAGYLEVSDSTIRDNEASRAGGGIETTPANGRRGVNGIGPQVSLTNAVLVGNSTGSNPGNGGGLHVTGATTVNVADSVVKDNTAASEGGGLWNASGTMTVASTVVKGNAANGDDATNGGGGLFQNAGGTLIVEDGSSVVQNDALGTSGSGGGILNDQGTLNVTDSAVSGNDAARAGGGIEANIGSSTLNAVLLSKNGTGANPGNGGGFHLTGAGSVDIDDSAVVQNTATNEGGGLWNSSTGTMDVDTTAICNNVAPTGANVFNAGGTFTVNGSAASDGTPCADNAGGSEPPPVVFR